MTDISVTEADCLRMIAELYIENRLLTAHVAQLEAQLARPSEPAED